MERNRAKKHQIEIARTISSFSRDHSSSVQKDCTPIQGYGTWRVSRTDWRGMVKRLREVDCNITEFPPANSSKKCSRCARENRDPRGVSECKTCGLKIERKLNAAINLYLKMDGIPYEREWWDRNILPSISWAGTS